ncbi:unnamed protein product, partial [Brassica rapa subsp. trilocularis]
MEYTLTNKLNINKVRKKTEKIGYGEEPDLLAILTLWLGLV